MQSTKIAILTNQSDRSPKVLAQSLHAMLKKLHVSSTIFFAADGILKRLLPLTKSPKHWQSRWYYRFISKIQHAWNDFQFLANLRKYDAVIISYYIPSSFWKNYFAIEELRKYLPGIPIILYEVYYLGNTPSKQQELLASNDYGLERYNWHLSVSEITENRGHPVAPWSAIGLELEHTGITPKSRDKFLAIVDFPRNDFDLFRQEQLSVLDEIGIESVQLQGEYTLQELRTLYQKGSIFFLQSPESFGIPIAECLAGGCAIFTPKPEWPMAFRLPDENKTECLPECFYTYQGKEDLRQKINEFYASYHRKNTPKRIATIFKSCYPTFWQGNITALKEVVERIEEKKWEHPFHNA